MLFLIALALAVEGSGSLEALQIAVDPAEPFVLDLAVLRPELLAEAGEGEGVFVRCQADREGERAVLLIIPEGRTRRVTASEVRGEFSTERWRGKRRRDPQAWLVLPKLAHGDGVSGVLPSGAVLPWEARYDDAVVSEGEAMRAWLAEVSARR